MNYSLAPKSAVIVTPTPLVARDAEADADADLAKGLLEDVGLVAGGVHPGLHDGVGRAELAGAPGEVLAQRPARGALGVAGAEDAVDERVAVAAGVVEVALGDHRHGVSERALRSFAFSLSGGRSRFARIWLCRQRIAARTASRFSATGSTPVFWHVIAADLTGVRSSPSAIVAMSACAGAAANIRPAATAATGTNRRSMYRHGDDLHVDRMCRAASSATRVPIRGTFPSAARLAHGAPWLCAPPSRTVCPCREARTSCCPQ